MAENNCYLKAHEHSCAAFKRSRAVSATLGPKGRNVVIDEIWMPTLPGRRRRAKEVGWNARNMGAAMVAKSPARPATQPVIPQPFWRGHFSAQRSVPAANPISIQRGIENRRGCRRSPGQILKVKDKEGNQAVFRLRQLG